MVNSKQIEKAVAVLNNGGIVAFPTETYYGLAVDPTNESALQRLFDIKKRPQQKPILLIINDTKQLEKLTGILPAQYDSLIEKYWPGPLSLIFNALFDVSPLLTAATGTVGVRISSHPIADQLTRSFGGPITATSANVSGRNAAVSALEVKLFLNDSVDLILDGGMSQGGIGSTIVRYDDSSQKLLLIRKGMISSVDIQIICPEIVFATSFGG